MDEVTSLEDGPRQGETEHPPLWRGELQKQGGKHRDKWEVVEAELSGGWGLTWSLSHARARGSQKMLKPEELVSAAPWSELGSGVEYGFEVVSTVKGGKIYRFAAGSEAECDELVEALTRLVGSSAVGSENNPLAPPKASALINDTRRNTELRECMVCMMVQSTMQAWPNPECEHEFCVNCMKQLLDGAGQRLDVMCPQCRRPALRDDGTVLCVESGPVRGSTERPPGMWPVLCRTVVKDGADTRTAEQLGELRPGDWVSICEEKAIGGHRRVRIGEGMWVSRVTKKGLVMGSLGFASCTLLFEGFDWVYGSDPNDLFESGHVYTFLVALSILCAVVATLALVADLFSMLGRPRRSSAVAGFSLSYPLQYVQDEWAQLATMFVLWLGIEQLLNG